MRSKERSRPHSMKVRGEAASAGGGAATGYPDLAKIIHGGGYTKQAFNADVQSYIGRRCHLGLS